jgi:hypothetical protein
MTRALTQNKRNFRDYSALFSDDCSGFPRRR